MSSPFSIETYDPELPPQYDAKTKTPFRRVAGFLGKSIFTLGALSGVGVVAAGLLDYEGIASSRFIWPYDIRDCERGWEDAPAVDDPVRVYQGFHEVYLDVAEADNQSKLHPIHDAEGTDMSSSLSLARSSLEWHSRAGYANEYFDKPYTVVCMTKAGDTVINEPALDALHHMQEADYDVLLTDGTVTMPSYR